MNIAKQLIDCYAFEKLSETFQGNPIYTKKLENKKIKLLFIKNDIIDTQYLGTLFNPKLFVFLSRHSSAKAIPTLSVHTPGNLSDTIFGGLPKTVSVSPAVPMKNALLEMAKQVDNLDLDYTVCYECTHHGPSLDKPAMFAELGSSPKQWNDLKAAKVVADAVVAAVTTSPFCSIVLGIGGPHYNQKFTKLALTTHRAFGHIIPKYALAGINDETIRQCIQRTMEPIDSIILDWKGIKGEHKPKIISTMEKLNLHTEKV